MNSVFRTGDVAPWKYFAGVALVLAVLFALMGPEGTTDRGLLTALLQWGAQAALPMALAMGAHIMLHTFRSFDHLRPWLKLVLSGSTGAVLFAPVAYLIDLTLGLEPAPASGQVLPAVWNEFAALYLPVTLVWVAINLPFVLGYRLALHPDTSKRGEDAVEDQTGFMALVPRRARGEVIYLKSELHYLSVVTTSGRSLVLYALKDAVEELGGYEGCRTHRSYWANLAQVDRLVRDGRRGVLRMKDGSEVPVSRTQVKRVQGLLH
jgi:hypothetical protein